MQPSSRYGQDRRHELLWPFDVDPVSAVKADEGMIGHQRQNALQVILVLRCHQKPVLSDHGLCLQKQGLTADAPQQIPVGDLRVETVGIKRLAKAGVVAAHAPAGGKRRPGPERDAQVSVGVFPAVFRRRRDRSGTQPFPRLQGEKLPDPLAGEIVQDEVGLLALVQKIMADRGQIHIVEGTFPPLALAGEKGWVLQHQGAAQVAAARMKSKALFIMTPLFWAAAYHSSARMETTS